MSNMVGNLETKIVLNGGLFPMGTKGYSAYEVAVQQGFKGTVDEWLASLIGPPGQDGSIKFEELTPEQKEMLRGPQGKSGVYVGTEEPTGSMVNVWINPQGEDSGMLATKEDVYNEAQTRETMNNNLQSQINTLPTKEYVNELVDSEANTRKATNVDLQNQINSLASGSPLVATSINEMTNTTKVYVNTTDGNWYYYDGSTWKSGGVYQATGLEDKYIDINHVNNHLANIMDVNRKEYSGNIYNFGLSGTTGIISGTSDVRLCTDIITNICSIKLTPNTGYKFHLFTYNEDEEFIESTGWKTTEYIANTNYKYKYRVLIGKINDSDISENGVVIAIDELKHNISYMELDNELKDYIKINEEKINLSFELGDIDNSGNLYSNTRSIRTSDYYQFKTDVVLNCYKHCNYYIFTYDKNKNFISKSFLFDSETKFAINPKYYYKIVVFFKTQVIMNANMNNTIFEAKYFYTLNDILNANEYMSDYIMEFAAPYYSEGSILSDICIVHDKLFIFGTSDDEHINKVYGHVYYLDIPNKLNTYIKRFTHNFGHVNAVNYCKETDCLIFGNGSGDYTQLGKFYVYPNFYANYKNGTTEFLISDCIEYDCSSMSIGSEYKFNAIWGDNNYGNYDIAVLITNDNRNIRTIQLGKGTNELPNGTFISGKNCDEFNGTFKIQKEYTQDTHGTTGTDNTYCVQGASYNNGHIYCGIGHGHIEYWKMRLTNNSIIREEFFDFVYDSNGNDLKTAINGIEVKDDYYIFSYRGRIVIYKNKRI